MIWPVMNGIYANDLSYWKAIMQKLIGKFLNTKESLARGGENYVTFSQSCVTLNQLEVTIFVVFLFIG